MIWKGYVEKWSGEIKINRDIHSYIYKERKENKKKTNLNTHTTLNARRSLYPPCARRSQVACATAQPESPARCASWEAQQACESFFWGVSMRILSASPFAKGQAWARKLPKKKKQVAARGARTWDRTDQRQQAQRLVFVQLLWPAHIYKQSTLQNFQSKI